ncbi:MAG: type II toxin-antitoxin system ParD family antitoxin [Terriglobia bacterium]
MPTRNINLTDHLDSFVEDRVTSGRYGNASEIVREGLRLLEQREQEEQAKLEWLRKAAKEGFDQIDRGEGMEFRSMEDLDEHIDQLGKEASAQLRAERNRA